MIYTILSLIVGVSAAILVWAIFVFERDLSPSTLKRLDRIKRKTNIIIDNDSNEAIDINAEDADFQFKLFESLFAKTKLSFKIKRLLKLSDTNMAIDRFMLLSLFWGLIGLSLLLTPAPLMAILSILLIFVPTMSLTYKKNKRFIEFSKQFPDALNLMASSLRAGHPLFAAMDVVTDEMPKPLCEVFATARKDISLGIDTKDAFLGMTKSMPDSIDLRFFITAVLIQKEVGGNLAELLDSLSSTIRERFKLMGQLRVQTAQTRLSGLILGVVPIGVLLIIFFMNPDYIAPLFNTQDGKIAFAAAICMIIAGFISIKKISTIEF